VRVGVDVGGTFTKAVALDADGHVVARAVRPTSHEHADGVAAGVVAVVADVAEAVGAGTIELVTHSTTQAVNALLEGDVPPVGIVGMATQPNVRKARKRTMLEKVELTDGRPLRTTNEFLDVTDGLDPAAADAVLDRLVAAGAGAVAVAEAFAPDDTANEQTVAALAAARGLPATTSAELTGLYGLELRTLTAALNASILPIALRTAEVVDGGVAAAGIAAPLMVMRGDGGATDLAGFRRAPARTLYSGPAASVAGALRTGRVDDAVIVEVGGTSTNVAAIHAGRPALSYVQVGRHATAIRALDVRVAGVAGGSMLRVRRRGVYGVGPRSAHIAGLPYSCFLPAAALDGATTEEIAPRPGDPADYLVLRLASGERAALTNTCAANALGLVAAGDYAWADPAAAVAAFAVAGAALRLPGPEVARRMLAASSEAIGDLVAAVAAQHHLKSPVLVAVGGGAGTLGRTVATALGFDIVVPESAEVISSIGDALSLVRAERERTFGTTTVSPADIDALVDEVEAEVLAAGAGPASVDVQVIRVPERGAVRAVATGALALASGVTAGRPPITASEAAAIGRAREVAADPEPVGPYWVASDHGRVVVLDRFGDVVLEVKGEAVLGAALTDGRAELAALLERHVRHMGPVTVSPTAWLLRGSRLAELGEPDAAALAEVLAVNAHHAELALVVGRS
jgi:N-methylhydantoinase A/oxoprolinase/acetone carboxylase beta subunit